MFFCFSCSIMTGVNIWLRRLFIGFNVFFVIAGGLVLLVSLALLSPSLRPETPDGPRDAHRPTPHLSVLQVDGETTRPVALFMVGSVTVGIALLGAWGGCKESRGALMVFLSCMLAGCLLMLRAGVLAAGARPELEGLMEKEWRSFLPLDGASDDIKQQVEALQTSLHCCGVFGPEDWGDGVPGSCLCALEGECQTVKYKNFLSNLLWQQKSVFRQSCFPFIMASVRRNANITLCIIFTLFGLALLGLLLSLLMICEMFGVANRLNVALSVPVMLGTQPPSYQQLYDLPEEEERDTFKQHE